MKLKEFIKKYYDSPKEITMRSNEIFHVYKELILPGAFTDESKFRKTIAWNLDRDIYFREVTKENGSDNIYATLTTGKIDLFVVFDDEKEFEDYIKCGLKKHRQYRKDSFSYDPSRTYLYYSRKYE